jgi:hypothetical protein
VLLQTLATVLDALAYLPEGQTAAPDWTPGFRLLVRGYLAEVAYLRRISAWELRQSMEE